MRGVNCQTTVKEGCQEGVKEAWRGAIDVRGRLGAREDFVRGANYGDRIFSVIFQGLGFTGTELKAEDKLMNTEAKSSIGEVLVMISKAT